MGGEVDHAQQACAMFVGKNGYACSPWSGAGNFSFDIGM